MDRHEVDRLEALVAKLRITSDFLLLSKDDVHTIELACKAAIKGDDVEENVQYVLDFIARRWTEQNPPPP